MSAAKIPSIRARMRAQEILALELAGPVEAPGKPAKGRRQARKTDKVLRRTGDAARRIMRTFSADIVAG